MSRHHPCYSSISAYNACPAQFKVLYVDGDPGLTTEALSNGQQVHEFIQRYACQCYEHGKRPCDPPLTFPYRCVTIFVVFDN